MSTTKPPQSRKRIVSRKPAFLAAFRTTCRVTQAAKAVGIDPTLHYKWLLEDPEYRVAFLQTRDQAAQILEDEAVRRAHEGVKKPMYYRGKPVFHGKTRSYVYETEYSDQLLSLLLKRFRPDDYRERTETQITGSIDLVERLHTGRQRLIELKKTDDSAAG